MHTLFSLASFTLHNYSEIHLTLCVSTVMLYCWVVFHNYLEWFSNGFRKIHAYTYMSTYLHTQREAHWAACCIRLLRGAGPPHRLWGAGQVAQVYATRQSISKALLSHWKYVDESSRKRWKTFPSSMTTACWQLTPHSKSKKSEGPGAHSGCG